MLMRREMGQPLGVLVGGWEWWVGLRSAVEGTHHTLSKKKVAKEASNQKILTEKLLKQSCDWKRERDRARDLTMYTPTRGLTSGNGVPGNGVSDGREDPVQFTKRSTSVIQSTRYPTEGEKVRAVPLDLPSLTCR